MKTIVKQENYNNIEIEIDDLMETEYGYNVYVLDHANKFFDNEIIDIVTSMKDDTRTIIVTDSAFEGFHAWYAKLNVSKMHETNDELVDYSNDDLMFEIRRLRNEIELLKQDVEMLKLDKLDSNKQSYPYPQYPNIVYSTTWSSAYDDIEPNKGNNDIIF